MSTDDPPTPLDDHDSKPDLYDGLDDHEVPANEAARRTSLRPPQDPGTAALFEAPDPAAVSGAHPRLAEDDLEQPTDHEVTSPGATNEKDDPISDTEIVILEEEEEEEEEAPTWPHPAAASAPVVRSLPPPTPAPRLAKTTTAEQSTFWTPALTAPAPGVPQQISPIRPTTPGLAATPPVVAAPPAQISLGDESATGSADDFQIPLPDAMSHEEAEPLGMAPFPTDEPAVMTAELQAPRPLPTSYDVNGVIWKADPGRTTDPPPEPEEAPERAGRKLVGALTLTAVLALLSWIGVQFFTTQNPPVTPVARPQPLALPVTPPTVVYRPTVPPAPFPVPPPVVPAPSTPTPQAAPPPCRPYGSFTGANGTIDPNLPRQLGYTQAFLRPGETYGPQTLLCRTD